jgi:hypothetical protein
MSKNDRAIYWLVAQGRLTVAEAERLLAASGNREVVWVVITAILVAVLALNDPSTWLAGAAEGMLHGVPCLGELAHRVQTALMGI